MKIPWPDGRCIACLARRTLSEEHIIPESLGGDLTCKFLCKPCNDRFGSRLEGEARKDPTIRSSVAALRAEIPDVHAKLEERQLYRIEAGPATLVAVRMKGGIRGRVTKLDDGSLMVPEDLVNQKLREMLLSEGHTDAFISEALRKHENAEFGQRIELSNTTSVIKWTSRNLGPDFNDAEQIPDLLLLKIAYEFAALLVGSAICAESPQLNEIRSALCKNSSNRPLLSIERLIAPSGGAYHGIVFEGNHPYARIQIRLFGKLAYRVHLLNLAIQQVAVRYTYDLKSRQHHIDKVTA